MAFKFESLDIPGVILIEPTVLHDGRGFFLETYKRSEFAAAGIHEAFVQENQSFSRRGVLRGLHYQRPPYAQSKLVRVLSGTIFDVAVDLRPDSPTAGRWVATTLSSTDRKMIYIPSWCAHGYCVLSDTAEVCYLTSAEYAPEHESGIVWNDPALQVKWPVETPTVSARDQNWSRWTVDGLQS
jgi:dTDP-4-dehydrorhamnose 3,5-epimerase